MSAATAQLGLFRRLCSASSFPVGNYLYPVVVIILQHAADPIIHLISTCNHRPRLSAVPSIPQPPSSGAGVKGTDPFQLCGGGGRNEMRQGNGGVGKTMEDGCPLDQHPPSLYTHIFGCFCLSCQREKCQEGFAIGK